MKRLISALLCVCMVVSLLSVFPAFAATDPSTEGIGFDYAEEYYPSIKSGNDLYHVSKSFDKFPHTYEAWVMLPTTTTEAGVLMGNKVDGGFYVNIEITKNGNPYFYYTDAKSKLYNATFDTVNLFTGEWIHLAIVLNPENNTISCYKNGQLAETQYFYPDYNCFTSNIPFIIGGDGDYQNNPHFKGRIKGVTFYSDARTATEVLNDYSNGADLTDADIIADYTMSANKAQKDIADNTSNGYDLIYSDLWVEESAVQAWRNSTGMERAYSIAVIGDTQYSVEKYPDTVAPMYQWIVDNKVKNNTVYTIGLGDITNRDTYYEWENAKTALKVLENGGIPYSLVRGNHDLKNYSAASNNKYYDHGGVTVGASTKGYAFDEYFAVDTEADTDYIDQFKGETGGLFESNSVMNSWRTLEIANSKWLLLNLDYAPADCVLNWASDVVEAHPNHKVIVSTHGYLNRTGEHALESAYVGEKSKSGVKVPANDTTHNYGVQIWEKFASQHENIELVLSGHISSTVNTVMQRKGVNGNTVTEILIDGQSIDDRYKGLGFVAMFYFNADGTQLEIEYYSATAKKYYRTANLQSINLNATGDDYDFDGWNGLVITPSGTGTKDDPYLIENAGNLYWMSQNIKATNGIGSFAGKYFKQTRDIDIGGKAITSIGFYNSGDKGMYAFGGYYDGCGYSIKNGTITGFELLDDSENYIANDFTKDYGYGLFGAIYGATVKNIVMDNITVVGRGVTGMVVGKAAGRDDGKSTVNFNTIANCQVKDNCKLITLLSNGKTAAVSSEFDQNTRAGIVGSIVGIARSATIKYCVSALNFGAADQFNMAGGIVGAAGFNTAIDHCGFTGSITLYNNKMTRQSAFGGIVGGVTDTVITEDIGENQKGTLNISNCYNEGDFKYTGTSALTIGSSWGGIIGTVGRLNDIENRTTAPTANEQAAYMISNCHNGTALSIASGSKDATGGIIGRGFAPSANLVEGTMWIKNSSTVAITRRTAGLSLSGCNAYNYVDNNTSYGFKAIMTVGDSEALTVDATTSKSNIDALKAEIAQYATDITGAVNWSFDSVTGTLKVFGVGSIADCEVGNAPWSAHTSDIKKVVICDAITGIGANAFAGCTNLETVEAHSGIASIGDGAFSSTAFITNTAAWSSDTLYIGNILVKARQNSSKEYNINVETTAICKDAFSGITADLVYYGGNIATYKLMTIAGGNDALNTANIIYVGESINGRFNKETGTLTIYGTGAMSTYATDASDTPWYRFKDSITSVVFEEGVTTVGKHSFKTFDKITSVTLCKGITTIASGAFQNTSITSINIPVSVTTMGSYLFYGTPLNTIYYDGSRSQFDAITVNSAGNTVFNNATVICALNTEWALESGTLTISGNGSIEDYAQGGAPWYSEAANITKVVVSDGITSIGANAFYGLTNLSSVEIAQSVTTIDTTAFDNSGYINNAENWTDNTLVINSILVKAKSNTENTFKIATTVTSVSANAFTGITVDTVYYGGTKAQWENVTVNDPNSALTSAYFVYEGESINWLYDKTTKTITIFGTGPMQNYTTETETPWYSLKNEVENVVIESGVTTVGYYLFRNFTKIKNVTLPEGVTSIGKGAFQSCPLESINFPSTLITIHNYSFYNTKLKEIVIPASVTSIGNNVFNSCSSLKSAKVLCDATTLNTKAFYNCASLEVIYLSKSIVSIKSNAFGNCTSLKTVYYTGTESEYGNISMETGNSVLTASTTNVIYSYHEHKWQNTYTTDNTHHWLKCEYCNETTENAKHEYLNFTPTSSASCTENAKETGTCVCGKTYTRDIENTAGHKWQTVYSKDNTHHWFDCDKCNEDKDKMAHSFTNYVYNNDATTEKDGTETATCVCGQTDTRTKAGTKLESSVEIKDTAAIFGDVKTGSWYKEFVDYAYSYGMFNGTTATTFEPNANMNRAMFVSVLARIAGVTVDNTVATKFSDVPANKWYTGAVKWASDNGIVTGKTETTFAPLDNITREQMCALIVRFATYENITLKADGEAENFTDADKISGYAKEAVTACQKAGLVNGMGDGTFAPKGKATRAQVSKILAYFHKNYIA